MDTRDIRLEHEHERVAGVGAIASNVTINHETDHDYVKTWVADQVLREKLSFMHGAFWHTTKRVRDLPPDALLCAVVMQWQESAALKVRGLLAYVSFTDGDACTVWIYSGSYSPGDAEAAIAQLKGWLEPKKEPHRDKVLVGFRYVGQHGFAFRSRGIEAPLWADIRDNYAGAVQDAVDRLVAEFKPSGSGKLMLLHGLPGTGKTYVIRALAREWKEWCRFEYIADPEAFFRDANYMMHVLIEGNQDHDDEDGDDGKSKRWRMLVLEDAGELLARDAKAREGQGLSRLLNMSEGLIGQGLRVMTLISTNERLETLNEAVSRPGRTVAEIEFTELSVDESNAWLAVHKQDAKAVGRPMTLAELFALTSGAPHRTQKQRRPIGFRANERE